MQPSTGVSEKSGPTAAKRRCSGPRAIAMAFSTMHAALAAVPHAAAATQPPALPSGTTDAVQPLPSQGCERVQLQDSPASALQPDTGVAARLQLHTSVPPSKQPGSQIRLQTPAKTPSSPARSPRLSPQPRGSQRPKSYAQRYLGYSQTTRADPVDNTTSTATATGYSTADSGSAQKSPPVAMETVTGQGLKDERTAGSQSLAALELPARTKQQPQSTALGALSGYSCNLALRHDAGSAAAAAAAAAANTEVQVASPVAQRRNGGFLINPMLVSQDSPLASTHSDRSRFSRSSPQRATVYTPSACGVLLGARYPSPGTSGGSHGGSLTPPLSCSPNPPTFTKQQSHGPRFPPAKAPPASLHGGSLPRQVFNQGPGYADTHGGRLQPELSSMRVRTAAAPEAICAVAVAASKQPPPVAPTADSTLGQQEVRQSNSTEQQAVCTVTPPAAVPSHPNEPRGPVSSRQLRVVAAGQLTLTLEEAGLPSVQGQAPCPGAGIPRRSASAPIKPRPPLRWWSCLLCGVGQPAESGVQHDGAGVGPMADSPAVQLQLPEGDLGKGKGASSHTDAVQGASAAIPAELLDSHEGAATCHVNASPSLGALLLEPAAQQPAPAAADPGLGPADAPSPPKHPPASSLASPASLSNLSTTPSPDQPRKASPNHPPAAQAPPAVGSLPSSSGGRTPASAMGSRHASGRWGTQLSGKTGYAQCVPASSQSVGSSGAPVTAECPACDSSSGAACGEQGEEGKGTLLAGSPLAPDKEVGWSGAGELPGACQGQAEICAATEGTSTPADAAASSTSSMDGPAGLACPLPGTSAALGVTSPVQSPVDGPSGALPIVPQDISQLPLIEMIQQLRRALGDVPVSTAQVAVEPEEVPQPGACRSLDAEIGGGAVKDATLATAAQLSDAPMRRCHSWGQHSLQMPGPGCGLKGPDSSLSPRESWEGRGRALLTRGFLRKRAAKRARSIAQLGSTTTASLRSSGSRGLESSWASGLGSLLRPGADGVDRPGGLGSDCNAVPGFRGTWSGVPGWSTGTEGMAVDGQARALRASSRTMGHGYASQAPGSRWKRAVDRRSQSADRLHRSMPAPMTAAGSSPPMRRDARRWRPCGSPSPRGAFPDRDMYAAHTALSMEIALNAVSPREQAARCASAGKELVSTWQRGRWRPCGSPSPRGHFPDKDMYASWNRPEPVVAFTMGTTAAGGANRPLGKSMSPRPALGPFLSPPHQHSAARSSPSSKEPALVAPPQSSSVAAPKPGPGLASPVQAQRAHPSSSHAKSPPRRSSPAAPTSYASVRPAVPSPARQHGGAAGLSADGGHLSRLVAAMLDRRQEHDCQAPPGYITTSLTCVSIQDLLPTQAPLQPTQQPHRSLDGSDASFALSSHFDIAQAAAEGATEADAGGAVVGALAAPPTSMFRLGSSVRLRLTVEDGGSFLAADYPDLARTASGSSASLAACMGGATRRPRSGPKVLTTISSPTMPTTSSFAVPSKHHGRAPLIYAPVPSVMGGSNASSPLGSTSLRLTACSPTGVAAGGQHTSPRTSSARSSSALRCLGSYAANAARKSGQQGRASPSAQLLPEQGSAPVTCLQGVSSLVRSASCVVVGEQCGGVEGRADLAGAPSHNRSSSSGCELLVCATMGRLQPGGPRAGTLEDRVGEAGAFEALESPSVAAGVGGRVEGAWPATQVDMDGYACRGLLGMVKQTMGYEERTTPCAQGGSLGGDAPGQPALATVSCITNAWMAVQLGEAPEGLRMASSGGPLTPRFGGLGNSKQQRQSATDAGAVPQYPLIIDWSSASLQQYQQALEHFSQALHIDTAGAAGEDGSGAWPRSTISSTGSTGQEVSPAPAGNPRGTPVRVTLDSYAAIQQAELTLHNSVANSLPPLSGRGNQSGEGGRAAGVGPAVVDKSRLSTGSGLPSGRAARVAVAAGDAPDPIMALAAPVAHATTRFSAAAAAMAGFAPDPSQRADTSATGGWAEGEDVPWRPATSAAPSTVAAAAVAVDAGMEVDVLPSAPVLTRFSPVLVGVDAAAWEEEEEGRAVRTSSISIAIPTSATTSAAAMAHIHPGSGPQHAAPVLAPDDGGSTLRSSFTVSGINNVAQWPTAEGAGLAPTDRAFGVTEKPLDAVAGGRAGLGVVVGVLQEEAMAAGGFESLLYQGGTCPMGYGTS